MTIKNFQSLVVLAKSQMVEIKGGISVKAVVAVSTNAASDVAVAVVEALADDKRPPRPGGGISTL